MSRRHVYSGVVLMPVNVREVACGWLKTPQGSWCPGPKWQHHTLLRQARPGRSEPGTQLQSWSWPLVPASEREKSSRSECVVWSDDVSVASDQVAVTEGEGCGQWQPAEWSREGPRTGTHHTQDNTFPVLIKIRLEGIHDIFYQPSRPECHFGIYTRKLKCSKIILRMS